jgi:hypothetical protein
MLWKVSFAGKLLRIYHDSRISPVIAAFVTEEASLAAASRLRVMPERVKAGRKPLPVRRALRVCANLD